MTTTSNCVDPAEASPVLSLVDAAEATRVEMPVEADVGRRLYFARTASMMLKIVVKYAIRDMQEHAGMGRPVGGTGGCFPGPYRKLETTQEKFIYRAERMLYLGKGFTSAQVHDFIDRVLATTSYISENINFCRDSADPSQEEEADDLPPKYESILKQLHVPITLPLGLVRLSRTDQVFGLHAPADPNQVLASIGAAGDENESKSESVSAQSSPKPNGIRAAEVAYHNAGRTFVDYIQKIPKASFNVASYTKTVLREDYNGYHEATFIAPQGNYIALATALRDRAPLTISYDMVQALHKEIVGRKLVDDWYTKTQEHSTQKDGVEAQKRRNHQTFRMILEETIDILIETLGPRMSTLEARLIWVAERVRENAQG